MKKLIKQSDWLASEPYFYDTELGASGESIWDTIPAEAGRGFHPEGLFNYLAFGYSVLEQTPLQGIKFLRHSSRLWRNSTGGFDLELLEDPFDGADQYRLSEADVIDLICARVQAWEAALPADMEIVLPLSGGLDSRLLLWCLKDKSRIHAYTYGLSDDQAQSSEVIHAQALARHFGIRWERIPLGGYHRYFPEWDAQFGVSVHAHGMYHCEFYSKIRSSLPGRQALLSGIIGDAWAGSLPMRQIDTSANLVELGLTHGLCADPGQLRLPLQHEARERFWEENRGRLCDPRFQVVTMMRFKLMLLSYLMRVPRRFGFSPWSPFLDIDVALAMLNLPAERRANRAWLRDFFRKEKLDMESQELGGTRQNSLNFQAMRQIPLRPLQRELLGAIVAPAYVDWINHHARMTTMGDLVRALSGMNRVGEAVRRMAVAAPPTLEAYYAYLCLRPLENLLGRYA